MARPIYWIMRRLEGNAAYHASGTQQDFTTLVRELRFGLFSYWQLAPTVIITRRSSLFILLSLSYAFFMVWRADKVLVYFRGFILTPSNSLQHMRGCLQGKTEEEMCFTSTILYTLLVENKKPICQSSWEIWRFHDTQQIVFVQLAVDQKPWNM